MISRCTIALAALCFSSTTRAAVDLNAIPPDLFTPAVISNAPTPGLRVRHQLPQYANTEVYHALYLPTDWEPNRTYPVIIEYAGNQWKTSAGTVDGSNLGYGLTAGQGAIWVCIPYVNTEEKRNQLKWWGDLEATVAYCKDLVRLVCTEFGGDEKNLFIAGFSRGAIACNYIGLHDDEVSALWRGFICHSHYDGLKAWTFPLSSREDAKTRLNRLGDRPQFISSENTTAATRSYLATLAPTGNFKFLDLPFPTHTDTWVLRNIPARETLREWFYSNLDQTASD